MKRVIILLLALALLIPTCLAEDAAEPAVQTVFFGYYEQDGNADNGPEPIEWIVLDVQEGRTMLISRYALDCQPAHGEKTDVMWSGYALRSWLNDTFFTSAFTAAEQTAVLSVAVPNDAATLNHDPEWPVTAADPTEDRVFLLSYQEVMQYFPTEADRKLTGTEYARNNGAKFLGLTSLGIGETDWWLRSLGKETYDGCHVDVFGKIGTKCVTDKLGIRPAIWLDTTADQASFPYTVYTQANELFAAGSFAEAELLYATLGTYAGSAAKVTECRYGQACATQDAGDWDTAIALFDALGDYQDCHERGRASRYVQAVEVQESGDIKGAIKLFTALGQYQDSSARLIACFEKLGTPIYYFSVQPVNAGKDTGYAKSNAITIKDPHFGWSLGRFFMTDFTRVTEDEAPIFIKTLGDSITLWFDLQQDIDALNGNDKLTIHRDENGYNQDFGIQRTDFGCGTLIVRHTNYQNAVSEPTIYTDFVLAKGTTGADTQITFHEEGDYEVALNYEIMDSELSHAFNKFNNYRVVFHFSIRNGNCMVYPFDVETGEELVNTAITPNGFYLDLARSRYLDINMKRTVLTDGANGVTEDERFNRPARDGDRYTQEGIYTITVSNRYTGETTTKTLFVGSEDLLEEYIGMGFSEDRLGQ